MPKARESRCVNTFSRLANNKCVDARARALDTTLSLVSSNRSSTRTTHSRIHQGNLHSLKFNGCVTMASNERRLHGIGEEMTKSMRFNEFARHCDCCFLIVHFTHANCALAADGQMPSTAINKLIDCCPICAMIFLCRCFCLPKPKSHGEIRRKCYYRRGTSVWLLSAAHQVNIDKSSRRHSIR